MTYHSIARGCYAFALASLFAISVVVSGCVSPESQCWASAQQHNTVESYKHFLDDCPSGQNAQAARESLSRAQQERLAQLPSEYAKVSRLSLSASDISALPAMLSFAKMYAGHRESGEVFAKIREFFSEGNPPRSKSITDDLGLNLAGLAGCKITVGATIDGVPSAVTAKRDLYDLGTEQRNMAAVVYIWPRSNETLPNNVSFIELGLLGESLDKGEFYLLMRNHGRLAPGAAVTK